MVFNSVAFGIFLALVFATYWSIPTPVRNAFLVAASYFFYGWWDWRFLSLLAISTLVDFTIGHRMAASTSDRRRTVLLVSSAVVNLGILATFKYMGFFVDSLQTLWTGLGWGELGTTIEVVLPVGISFYTFQTLSYSFDVYRRRIEPTRHLVDFAAYVAYFPQLVAGPIERAQHLLPQIEDTSRGRPRDSEMGQALLLILQGLFKKVVIADGVAAVANRVFLDPGDYSSLGVAVGVMAFGIQIYGDFSGYTDIARGVSKLFGIDLVVNFRQPYLSRNITEFWRRWHVSLSNWLRDYLYVPLGGNRRGTMATYRNLMITMLLGGLWHGASWNFVIWGGLHGLYLVVHKLTRSGVVSEEPVRIGNLPSILVTYAAVHLAWVFFRADTFGEASSLISRLIGFSGGRTPPSDLALVCAIGAIALLIDLWERRQHEDRLPDIPSPLLTGSVVAAALVGIAVFSGGTPAPFIYFQF